MCYMCAAAATHDALQDVHHSLPAGQGLHAKVYRPCVGLMTRCGGNAVVTGSAKMCVDVCVDSAQGQVVHTISVVVARQRP